MVLPLSRKMASSYAGTPHGNCSKLAAKSAERSIRAQACSVAGSMMRAGPMCWPISGRGAAAIHQAAISNAAPNTPRANHSMTVSPVGLKTGAPAPDGIGSPGDPLLRARRLLVPFHPQRRGVRPVVAKLTVVAGGASQALEPQQRLHQFAELDRRY